MSQPGKPFRLSQAKASIYKSVPIRTVEKQSKEKYKSGYWMSSLNTTGDRKSSIAVQKTETQIKNSNAEK